VANPLSFEEAKSFLSRLYLLVLELQAGGQLSQFLEWRDFQAQPGSCYTTAPDAAGAWVPGFVDSVVVYDYYHKDGVRRGVFTGEQASALRTAHKNKLVYALSINKEAPCRVEPSPK